MCLLDLFQGMEGGWGDHWHCMSLFWGIFVGTFKYKKWGDHQNKKLFINKSLKALTLFKKWHKGLWKLHMALRDCIWQYVPLWGKNWGSKKRILFEADKWQVRRRVNLLKYCVSIFWRRLGVFWWKNGEATEGSGFIVKCGETLSEGGGGLWKSHGWPYRNCWIHLVNIWWMFDWILSQNCRNTLPLHTVDQLASSANIKRLLWLAGMKCVKILTYCKA